MAKKMCEICGEKPATVPDRERVGRLINRVCSSCQALRLAGDMKRIFELHEKRRQAQFGHNYQGNRRRSPPGRRVQARAMRMPKAWPLVASALT